VRAGAGRWQPLPRRALPGRSCRVQSRRTPDLPAVHRLATQRSEKLLAALFKKERRRNLSGCARRAGVGRPATRKKAARVVEAGCRPVDLGVTSVSWAIWPLGVLSSALEAISRCRALLTVRHVYKLADAVTIQVYAM
jgi:hypothetical protein